MRQSRICVFGRYRSSPLHAYFRSLSCKTIVYLYFAGDLHNPLYKTHFALAHTRFSTNTLPLPNTRCRRSPLCTWWYTDLGSEFDRYSAGRVQRHHRELQGQDAGQEVKLLAATGFSTVFLSPLNCGPCVLGQHVSCRMADSLHFGL